MPCRDYLAVNGLDRVKVRINEYDPAGEWQRLKHNESVSWPVRYTLGTLSVVGYTLFPGRIFGGDRYNPYTDTINLYSDIPALAIFEGGYAKDFSTRDSRDLYAVEYGIPVVNLWHDSQAASDAFEYLQCRGSAEDVKEGYRAICPSFGASTRGVLPVVGAVPLALPA